MKKIIFGDKHPIDQRVYSGEQAITTQSFTEANVKNGSEFYIYLKYFLYLVMGISILCSVLGMLIL